GSGGAVVRRERGARARRGGDVPERAVHRCHGQGRDRRGGGGRSAPNPTWGYVGSAGSKQAEWRERVRAEGYAWPISASGVDGRYEAWENPRLDADLADPLFFELHTLSMVRADEDGWVLGFCPRSRHGNRPVIEGTAALARDTTFASAEW